MRMQAREQARLVPDLAMVLSVQSDDEMTLPSLLPQKSLQPEHRKNCPTLEMACSKTPS